IYHSQQTDDYFHAGKVTMRRLRLLITIAMMILPSLGFEAHAQDSSVSSEYLIKAGFIYNFANLVQWPTNAFAQLDSPIVIGILGEDPFGPVLDRVLAGKRVNGRVFLVKRLKSVVDLKECHILFVSSSAIAHLADAIHLVKGMPILTIGEIPGFAKRGGIINLVLEDNKVHFEVNVDAAKEADLTISSRLLALARIVQDPVADGKKTQ
ncbi:MAG TPA: YfiR family protein, partial [Chthoniobacterales bacterium]